uniref:Uncharacterized protein n=1 Tax=Acartia pacifica TaxID=335913 RepID=A0A0U2KDB9_ACAPC|nr:hypothetical protein [Acartia pacifica]
MIASVMNKASVATRSMVLKRYVHKTPNYNSTAHLNSLSGGLPGTVISLVLFGLLFMASPFHYRNNMMTTYETKYQSKE